MSVTDHTVDLYLSERDIVGPELVAARRLEGLTISLYFGVEAPTSSNGVLWWKLMSCARSAFAGLSAAAAACSVLLALGVPLATAGPSADSQGYVDSTARCATPDTAVAFGSTDTSRVAICKTPAGQYQYRGVRLRDGAKLVLPASRSSDGGYAANDDGFTYTVTGRSLTISQGSEVIRQDPMVDYHEPGAPPAPSATTAAPSATTPAPSATPPPTKPLPPPLPAEVGGRGH